MFHINLRGLDRHRAVEEDWERLDLARPEHLSEQQCDELSATDGERWHQYFAAAVNRFNDDPLELGNGFRERTMIAAAVGRFEKQEVRLLERFEFTKYRRASRSEVTGKHDTLCFSIFFDEQLNARRA